MRKLFNGAKELTLQGIGVTERTEQRHGRTMYIYTWERCPEHIKTLMKPTLQSMERLGVFSLLRWQKDCHAEYQKHMVA